MRSPRLITMLLLCVLCSCNFFTPDKGGIHPQNRASDIYEEDEIRMLRRQQDSLLEMRKERPRARPKSRGLDSLQPIHV